LAGRLRALIQSRPAGFTSSRIRAWVSIPRPPTRTTFEREKRWRTVAICEASVVGSAVLPGNASTDTGHPSRSHNRLNSICSLLRLPSRE